MSSAVARDQSWPDGGFAFALFCYVTNHLMTGPLGNSEALIKWDQSLKVFFFYSLLSTGRTAKACRDRAQKV